MTSFKNSKSRVEWVDIAKGIGILLVVFSHIVAAYSRRSGDIQVVHSLAIVTIDSFFMPLFFFLSGLFVKSDLKKSFIEVFKKKFVRLMIPYFVWGVFYLIFWAIYQHKMPFLRILELPVRPIFILWFIYSLFLCDIFFWLFQKNFSQKIVFFLAIIFYFCGFISSGVSTDSFFKPLVGFLQNFVFLDLGYLVSSYVLSNDRKRSFYWLCIPLTGVLLLMVHINENIASNNITLIFKFILAILIALLGILVILFLSFLISSYVTKSFLGKIGIYSMQIYIIHKVVVEVLSIIISYLSLNVFAFIFLNFILTLLICYLTILVIRAMHLSKLFFGMNS